MSVLVVDASVAAKWFLREPLAEEARRVLAARAHLHAPELFQLEMDSVFAKRVRRFEMTPEDAKEARRVLGRLPIQYHRVGSLRDMAFEIALQTRRSVYDCAYLALSVLLDGPMVTADRRFYEAIAHSSAAPHVVWVADMDY